LTSPRGFVFSTYWYRSATALISRLLPVAESRLGKIEAPQLASEVYNGTRFSDEVKVTT
jgi:hypothetical protein